MVEARRAVSARTQVLRPTRLNPSDPGNAMWGNVAVMAQ